MTYSNIISQQSSVFEETLYDPTKYLFDNNDINFYVMLKERNLQSMTKRQGGIKWHYTRSFHITLTVSYHILPRNQESLSDAKACLLCDNIGFNIVVNGDTPPPDQQCIGMDLSTLRGIGKAHMQDIVKSYSHSYTSKNIQKLIEQIKVGQLQSIILTEE